LVKLVYNKKFEYTSVVKIPRGILLKNVK